VCFSLHVSLVLQVSLSRIHNFKSLCRVFIISEFPDFLKRRLENRIKKFKCVLYGYASSKLEPCRFVSHQNALLPARKCCSRSQAARSCCKALRVSTLSCCAGAGLSLKMSARHGPAWPGTSVSKRMSALGEELGRPGA